MNQRGWVEMRGDSPVDATNVMRSYNPFEVLCSTIAA
jgi:hypothetical protein